MGKNLRKRLASGNAYIVSCITTEAVRPATLLKKNLWHRCSLVNFAKFLRTPFLQNTSGGCFCHKKGDIEFTSKLEFFFIFVMLTAVAKILECEESISPSSFYGLLSDYYSHVLAPST